MSKLCLANMTRDSSCNSPRASLTKDESVQGKLDKKWSRDLWLSCGFSCSSFRELSILEVCVFVLVFVESSLGSCGVRNQYVSFDYSGVSLFSKAFRN